MDIRKFIVPELVHIFIYMFHRVTDIDHVFGHTGHIDQLFKNIRYYTEKTEKRVTFEYILIDGLNDSKSDADQLIKLTSGLPCKINLIPCNSTDPKFPPTPNDHAKWFADYLHKRGRTATVRLRKGWEIEAACGQLYAKNEQKVGTKITSSKNLK